MSQPPNLTLTCPKPIHRYTQITMAHGGAGKLAQDLLEDVFLPNFSNRFLSPLEDQSTMIAGTARIAMTTDSFVIDPLFFPGGDIGKLAIFGTINDIAVGGGQPLYIAAAFIIEEGLDVEILRQVAASMGEACRQTGVTLVAGDTKVVEKGKGDKLFITTTALGLVPDDLKLSICHARPGDKVILSGNLGDHGVAIMSVREGLEFDSEIQSDCAPLHELAQLVVKTCPSVRTMRDVTRGGLATILNELAQGSEVGILLDECTIPVSAPVQGACEILGLDPLYIANEGKLIAVVPPDTAESVVEALRQHPLGREACIVAEVHGEHPRKVALRTVTGVVRTLPLLAGEHLPRIC